MNGLLGLAKNINTTDSAQRDLSILERMDSRIQTERKEEVVAQQQEQLMYERMYATADQMLEKDRNQLNKRIKMAQGQITDHFRTTGGSRKNFMEQGGLAVMGNISNDIIRSKEAIQYQENKKNLAKILEAKEKGLGHLIAPRDMKSLEDHENSEFGGAITYSGIMSEIEIPPSANFDYGKEIPLQRILSNKSNMMRITANYKMNYPEKPEPKYADIYAFAREMGYGGTGSNTTRLRTEASERMKAQQYAKSRATSKDTTPNSFLNQITTLYSQIDKGLNVPMINEKYDGNLIEALSKNNPSFRKILGDRFEPKSRDRKLSREGPDSTDFADSSGWGPLDTPNRFGVYLFNEKMGLREAYRILPHNTNEIAGRLFDEKIENGMVVGMVPGEQDYSMNGVKLTGDNKLDPTENKGNYKLLGATTAFKAKIANGQPGEGETRLLVSAYNDDDKTIDKDAQKTLDEGYAESEVQMTTVMAYENDNGDIFYREIDISDPQIKTVFSNALGEDDDITDTVNQQTRSKSIMNQIDALSAEEEVKLNGAINTMEKEVFQSPIFEQEGQKYWGAQSAGQQNRYPIMKSFYMAFDYMNNSYKRDSEHPQGDPNIYASQITQAVDKELFTTSAITGGIEEKLKSYEQGNSDDSIITQWLQTMNDGEKPYVQRRNTELAQKWAQMLSLMDK